MKRKIVILVSMLFCIQGFAYWEWTPKTGKWINPKYAVKDTPKEQFEWAEQFKKEGNIDIAIREYEKLVKHYPDSEYAAPSYFILGEIYRSKGENRKAFDCYQKIVENYPASPFLLEVIRRQAEIAEEEMKKNPGWFPFKRNDTEKGEMLATVIENHPYAEGASEKALELGRFYLKNKDYKKAKEIFSDIIMRYTDSSVLEEARFYLIKTEFLSVPEVSTDIKKYEGVKKQINTFLALYPESSYKNEVLKIKNKVILNEAKVYFDIASFYERTGEKKSARYYYNIVAENYPDTDYGKEASKKLRSSD